MFAQDQICAAIRDRRVLSFRYKMKERRVEPHTLGYDKSGDLVLCGWQTSGLKPGWRDFHVGKLSALSTTDASFAHARQGYKRGDKTLSRIVCQL